MLDALGPGSSDLCSLNGSYDSARQFWVQRSEVARSASWRVDVFIDLCGLDVDLSEKRVSHLQAIQSDALDPRAQNDVKRASTARKHRCATQHFGIRCHKRLSLGNLPVNAVSRSHILQPTMSALVR